MTISEAARLLGVSRQALYARIKRDPELSSELSTVDGVRHISETGLQRLKEAISEPPPVNTLTETLTATFTSTLTAEREAHRAEVERLHQEVDRLHADLEAERQHSRELAERLAVLVDQAQRLQMQQLQTPPRKVGLLELIFRHKED